MTKKYAHPTITIDTIVQAEPIHLSIRTLLTLEQVCRAGIPDSISEELRTAISEVICKTVNPMRPLIPFELRR